MSAGVVLRLLAVMVLWALCFPLITVGLGLAPHLMFAAMRATLAGLALLLVAVCLGRPLPRGLRSWALIGIVGIGSTSLGFFGMFHAAEFLSPGLATVIANTQPLLAAVVAFLLLHERMSAPGRIGLMIGFAGIAVIAWPGLSGGATGGYSVGIAYAALAAVGVTMGNVAIKALTGNVDAVMAMGLQMLIGAVPLALLSMLTEDVSSFVWSAEFALILVSLAVFGTSLAFWLWFGALERVGLNQANAFTFLVPLLGLAIGAVFFDERFGAAQAVGLVLAMTGIVLVHRGAPAAVRT